MPSLHLDAPAVKHLVALHETMNSPLFLCVAVKSGGCSGLRYNFSVEEGSSPPCAPGKALPFVHTVQEGISVVVDLLSLSFIDGATISYQEDMMGARFVLCHENFHSRCGCGSSFSI